MNKTGFKTFVYSFVFTLSVIVGTDRAFFYTPEKTEENLKIPRKNITLFFSQSHPQAFSSQTEPVYKEALKTPEFKPEELKIAQNIPDLPVEYAIKDILELSDNVEIPLSVEENLPPEQNVAEIDAVPGELASNLPSEEIITKKDQSAPKEDAVPDLPLVYAGLESKTETLSGAQKEIPLVEQSVEDQPIKMASVEADVPDLAVKPIIIKANKQIIKIDNLKKHKERLQQKEQTEKVQEAAKEEVIPLQKGKQSEDKLQENHEAPPNTQIAALEGNISLSEAEEQIVESEPETKRQWQTMAEKHHMDNPWVVARGSKFVKNKQLLKESFAKEGAEKKAEKLLPAKVTDGAKSTKLAVQDNLLIPIPQELLGEDDLVPDISNDGGEKTPPVKATKKENKKEKSFLDDIASVFSKENREKAIKNLKKKTSKLMDSGKVETETVRPQILPTEIRLSFQPNRAEISGQTLRWIQAFARKAVDEDNVGLEIRIDGSKSFELQQKRLNLLYNILTANEVPYQKINTIFVDREPNSFVVRTTKIVTENDNKKEDDKWKRYYQKW